MLVVWGMLEGAIAYHALCVRTQCDELNRRLGLPLRAAYPRVTY
jgi:hypothetical protein